MLPYSGPTCKTNAKILVKTTKFPDVWGLVSSLPQIPLVYQLCHFVPHFALVYHLCHFVPHSPLQCDLHPLVPLSPECPHQKPKQAERKGHQRQPPRIRHVGWSPFLLCWEYLVKHGTNTKKRNILPSALCNKLFLKSLQTGFIPRWRWGVHITIVPRKSNWIGLPFLRHNQSRLQGIHGSRWVLQSGGGTDRKQRVDIGQEHKMTQKIHSTKESSGTVVAGLVTSVTSVDDGVEVDSGDPATSLGTWGSEFDVIRLDQNFKAWWKKRVIFPPAIGGIT